MLSYFSGRLECIFALEIERTCLRSPHKVLSSFSSLKKKEKKQSLELIFLASTLGNTHITSVFKQHIRKGSGFINKIIDFQKMR